jgi:hypothetical protein
MGKKSNVHPDHYKTTGRDPQGQEVVHTVHRQRLKEQRSRLKEEAKKAQPGPEPQKRPEGESQEQEGSASLRNGEKPSTTEAEENR